MKKITTFGLFVLMGISATVFNGCKGKDGAPGAQGPAGSNGNANVSSVSTNLTSGNWSFDATYNEWTAIINSTRITADVVSNGTIQVFFGDATGATWGALPLSYGNIQINYLFELGKVTIGVTNSDGTAPTNPGAMTFKIVVIPNRSMLSKQNIDLKNYNEVKAAFKLKD